MPSADSTSNSISAQPLALPPALEAALASGALLIAPSAAAARQLREAFDATQRARGLLAWEPAPVVSWSQWLDSLWSDAMLSGQEARLLLNETQEHTLWTNIVSRATQADATRSSARQSSPRQSGATQASTGPNSDSADVPLASAGSLADLARNAWKLANAYAATSRLRSAATTHDARTFARWAEDFARECGRGGYLSRAGLEAALETHIAAKTLATPPRLDFAGFGDFTPAQQTLLDAFRAAGTEIILHEPTIAPRSEAERTILRADSEPEELRSLAHWIRRFIQQRQASGCTARVGVLLPSLDADRAAVEAVFREVLAPELQPIALDLSSTPYEFAAGKPLISIALIAVALDLARWIDGPLPLSNVSALLLSPYLGTLAGQDQSAQFDAYSLRQLKLLRPEIRMSALLALARKSTYGEAPLAWLGPLSEFVESAGGLRPTRDFAGWAEFFRGLVQSAGWPGEHPLTSNEFHATRAWDDVLDALATLDFQGQRVSLREAFHALERQIAGAVFSPPPTGAPVQIIGLASAVGLTFDALVLARATDANYPQPERANPLLGWGLQTNLDMPGVSQSRASERARRALDTLLAGVNDVLITYAAENADGPQRLSPTLAQLGWPQRHSTDWLATCLPASAVAAPVEEELVEDRDPLPPLPAPLVYGGARVLQLQAACGFRAFAEIRLRSTDLESIEAGFDAQKSGRILHRTMECFWARLETQAALRALTATPEALHRIVASCIDQAMPRALGPQDDWDKAFLALQRQRLLSLVQQWLEKELERSPFTVLQREMEQQISVGPLTLEVRFDRIDKLDTKLDAKLDAELDAKLGAQDPGFVLVDYKTGASGHPSQWEGDRPDDPQLPLYALPYQPQELKALAFAKVRAGEMKWLGYQAEPGILPATRANVNPVVPLSALIEKWRGTLQSLARDFAGGRATVDPKHYPQTCEHCSQRLLCRVDPDSLPDASAENEISEANDG